MKTPPTTFDAVSGLMEELSPEQRLTLTDSDTRPRLKRWLDRAERRRIASTFFVPLPDDEIPEQFRDRIPGYRTLAEEHRYKGWIAWQMRAGFTLKRHAPKAGPCYESWKYLQDWKLQNDAPTTNAILFGVPRLLTGSTKKTADEQITLLGETRDRLKLPPHHLASFGSAARLSGWILGHASRTGERFPLNGLYTRTDTLHAGGTRLGLDWVGRELGCDYWGVDVRSGGLGCVALGVEELGG